MVFRIIGVSLLVLLACGCGKGPSAAPPDDGKRIVVRVSHPEPPKELPEGMCFTGLYAYDVMLIADRLPSEAFCAQLATRLFPDVEQLPWSAKELINPDQVVECALTRNDTRLLLWRGDPDNEGPRFDRAEELTWTACGRLRKEGWKPLDLENL
jgi:hypothetical protein